MTDKPRIILDAKAWQEGFAAGRRGLKWEANPYPAGKPMHPARGSPVRSRVKRSRCGQRPIKDNPCTRPPWTPAQAHT
jgi:hypothetical protein